MDPILRHWLNSAGGTFASMGFLLRQHVTHVMSDTCKAIFHFELDSAPEARWGAIVSLVFMAIVIAAIWFSVPHNPLG